MVIVTVNGSLRADLGKKATKADRKAGRIPCVLYGAGGENVHFTTTFNEVRELIFTGDFKLAEVNVDDKRYKCILKDVQFHPVRDEVAHIDFLHLQEGRTIKVEVPLHFEGVSAGVRGGGKFTQKIRMIKIKTKPEHLVNAVVADVSELQLGQSLRVRDIKPQEGVEILNPPSIPIASVTVPRVLKEAAPAEAVATQV